MSAPGSRPELPEAERPENTLPEHLRAPQWVPPVGQPAGQDAPGQPGAPEQPQTRH